MQQKTILTFLYFMVLFLVGLIGGALGPTLNGLATNTGVAVSQIGFAITARSLGGLLGALLAGKGYQRFSPHHLLAISLVFIAFFLLGFSTTTWFVVLLIISFFLGFSHAVTDVGVNTLTLQLHASNPAPYMNGLHLMFGVGASLAPLIIAQSLFLGNHIGYAYAFYSLLLLPLAVTLYRQKDQVLSFATETPSLPLHSSKTVFLFTLCFFLYVGAEVAFACWICNFIQYFFTDKLFPYTLNSAFWMAFTAGRFLGIGLARKFCPSFLLKLDFVGILFGFGLFLAFPDQLVTVWLAAILLGISMASVFPNLFSFAGKAFSINHTISSYFVFGANLGAMIFPALAGFFFAKISPQSILILFSVQIVFVWLIFQYIYKIIQKGDIHVRKNRRPHHSL